MSSHLVHDFVASDPRLVGKALDHGGQCVLNKGVELLFIGKEADRIVVTQNCTVPKTEVRGPNKFQIVS